MPNPHLKRVPYAELPKPLQPLWEAAMRDRDEATFIEAAGNAPELLDWYYNGFYAHIFNGGRVDNRLKQLVRMKLSTVHGCAFCNRGNRLAALKAGVTEAQIDALDDVENGPFDAAERACLRLAEEMVLPNMQGYMSKPQYDALREHFDDAQIFELGFVMAVLTGMAKFLFVFDLVTREANCPIHMPAAAE